MLRDRLMHILAAALTPGRYASSYSRHWVATFDAPYPPDLRPTIGPWRLYLPLRLAIRHPQTQRNEALPCSASDIWGTLFLSRRLLMVGEPGSGKTHTLSCAVRLLAERKLPSGYVRRLTFLHRGRACDQILPIYASASRLDLGATDLPTALAALLERDGFPGACRLLRTQLAQGSCLLLIDGLERLSMSLQAQLAALIAGCPDALVLATTRRWPLADSFDRWTWVEPLPLSHDDVSNYLAECLEPASAARLRQALQRDPGLRGVASNPFLLEELVHCTAAAGQEMLSLSLLYGRCLEALLRLQPCPVGRNQSEIPVGRLQSILFRLGHSLFERGLETFSHEEVVSACRDAIISGQEDPGEDALADWLEGSALVRHGRDDRYRILRAGLLEYMTAGALAESGDLEREVGVRVADPRWHGVITLAAAESRCVDELAQVVLESSPSADQGVVLAARCLAEGGRRLAGGDDQLSARLRRLLDDGPDGIASEAALRIAALAGLTIEDYYSTLLKQGTPDERLLAARVLGTVGSPKWAVVPLLGALEAKHPKELRLAAASSLGGLEDRRAIPALTELLGEDDGGVAAAALAALARIGEDAVPALISALSSDSSLTRRRAIEGLAAMGPPAFEALLRLTRDETQPELGTLGAVEALGLACDSAAVPDLVRVLVGWQGGHREAAASALATIGAPAVAALVKALPTHSAELALRSAIVAALVKIGEAAIGPLIEALGNPSAEVRLAAEEGLSRIGAPAVDALSTALSTTDWSLRRRIAQVLANIGDERLMPTLLAAMQDQDAGVRAKAVQVLGTLGLQDARDALVRTMWGDPDGQVRRTAVRALVELRSEACIEPLIGALHEPLLRGIAVAGLAELGEPVVQPLIQAIQAAGQGEARSSAERALQALGAGARLTDRSMLAVARCYWTLIAERPDLATTLEWLQPVRWWQPADELYRVLFCAQRLALVENLSDVAACREELVWASQEWEAWRPPLRRVLQRLYRVSQDVGMYFQASGRAGQRDAMLGAIDALTDTEGILRAEMMDFERDALQPVLDRWRGLVEEAIKNLRGRAEINVEPLRNELPLESASQSSMMVFRLTNVGDSAARSLDVTLRSGNGHDFDVVGEPTQRLHPLGTGMQRDVEFWIKPLGAPDAGYVFEVSYDDDEGTGHFQPTSGRIRFLAIDSVYRILPSSPYVMGPPVKTREMFYGRQDVMKWIEHSVSGAHQENVLVLHGERRMGKTSILYQLLNQPPTPRHICVFYSLELEIPQSMAELLFSMARCISNAMLGADLNPPVPLQPEFANSPPQAFVQFFKEATALLGGRRLLIMMDEFDKVIHKVESGAYNEDVYAFLRGLWQHTEKAAFIITGAYKVREMLKDNRSILFHVAKPYQISYLGPKEAKDLIVRPVQGMLTYDNMVVDKILRVTACHPYFVQYICDSLVRLAQTLRKNWLFLPDLNLVLKEVIEDNAGVLQNAIYAPLSRAERTVLAALATITDDRTVLVAWETVAEALHEHTLEVTKQSLFGALCSLSERDLVVEKRIGRSLQYGFRMDLIRMWLRQNNMLLRLSQEQRL